MRSRRLPRSLRSSIKRAREAVRLFCFHHAGGSALTFSPWHRGLGPAIEVVPVEILDRHRFATLGDLVKEVNEQFRSAMDGPHMCFGHSFGALLAYRLACVRAAEGSSLPRSLFLSSFAPPHLPPPLPPVEHLDEHQLETLLFEIGGMPAELIAGDLGRALREKAVSAARNDLRLHMTDDDGDKTTLACPIHVFGGSEDPLVSESDLDEWRSRTSSDFSVNILRGDHFYLRDRDQLFATLRPLMSHARRSSH
jgi:surfactin synthase thioesterase subunit